MGSRFGIAAVVAVQLFAGIAFGQQSPDPAAPDEFGRVSGGELDVLTKHGSALSGSLSISASKSNDPFSTFNSGTAHGYGASVGGTLVPDRVWFFASAQQIASPIAAQFANDLPQTRVSHPIDAKAMAQIGDRSNLSASFASQIPTAAFGITTPGQASFLSLHYSAALSSNSFFSASFSQRRASSQLPIDLVPPR
jgi:hypothetical protein